MDTVGTELTWAVRERQNDIQGRCPVATVASSLRVLPEFDPSEYQEVTEVLAARLDRRLERFADDQVELEVSVKERDTPSQRVVLEGWFAVPGRSHFVGTSTRASLMAAVRETGEDLHKQVDRFLTKRETRRH